MSEDFIVKTAEVERETILLHPSQLHDVKKGLFQELHKKKNVWNDTVRGIITRYERVQLLNGGRAKIMDDSPYLHYQVRYIVHYLQPQIGQKVKAKIQNIQQGHISLTIEGRLTAIIPISAIDTSKYEIE